LMYRCNCTRILMSLAWQSDAPDFRHGNPGSVIPANECQFLTAVACCLVVAAISFRMSSLWVFHSMLKVGTEHHFARPPPPPPPPSRPPPLFLLLPTTPFLLSLLFLLPLLPVSLLPYLPLLLLFLFLPPPSSTPPTPTSVPFVFCSSGFDVLKAVVLRGVLQTAYRGFDLTVTAHTLLCVALHALCVFRAAPADVVQYFQVCDQRATFMFTMHCIDSLARHVMVDRDGGTVACVCAVRSLCVQCTPHLAHGATRRRRAAHASGEAGISRESSHAASLEQMHNLVSAKRLTCSLVRVSLVPAHHRRWWARAATGTLILAPGRYRAWERGRPRQTPGMGERLQRPCQSTAQHSTAQHSTAQHSTAQHSTAQHSTAQHSTTNLRDLSALESSANDVAKESVLKGCSASV
jgi:hypothetical protein